VSATPASARPPGASTGVRRFFAHPAHAVVALPLRVLVGVVFIYASYYKLLYPADFALSIAMYEMVPTATINLLALVLPAIELVAGVTLVIGLWSRASALVIDAMLVVFMVAIGYVVWVRGLADFGCGCFSPAAEEASGEMALGTFLRDAGYLAAGLYLLVVDGGALGVDGWLRRRRRASPMRET
jgi:putative oxidoreductase